MNRLLDLARFRARERLEPAPRAVPQLGAVRARSLCIVSGKGGTGKSVVAASLSRILARSKRTVLVDGDLGVGNAHILQGVTPRGSLADYLSGDLRIQALVEACGGGLDLLAGGSGHAALANLSAADLVRVGHGLAELERSYGQLVVDCGAGIGRTTLELARAADLVLLVTTPDLTALTDAYALLKVLELPRHGPAARLLVNRATGGEQAEAVFERIDGVARRFLGRGPEWVGWLPEDPEVVESVNHREPLVERCPSSPAARALVQVAVELQVALTACPPRQSAPAPGGGPRARAL